jgi:polygalacturonase
MSSEHSRRAFVLGALGLGATVPLSPAQAHRHDPWRRVPAILARVRPPRFPRRVFPITRYGAVGDGRTLCTEAFRRAIEHCHRSGGGRVLVPAGRFLTGAIHLRSTVELHVVADGTIAFSTDPADYLPAVFTRWEGTELYNYSAFIYAYGQRDIAVTGAGLLDGQGLQGPWESWYRTPTMQGPDQRELRRMGEEGVPVEQRRFGAGHYLRPNLIQFYRCRNVLIDGVTIHEPAMWTMHPVLCRNVTVRGVTVVSTLYNTDGVDIECSRDVHVHDCRFDTTDDCVVLKSGRDADGHRVGVPSEDVVVEDCKFSGRWGGLTVGSEMSGGVRNVFARNCEINAPDFPGAYPIKHALYVKTNKLRGGYIDGIHLRDFTGGDVEREAIYVILDYNNQVGTRPVVVRNITVDDMVLDGARAPLVLRGLQTDPIRQVSLRDVHLTNVTNPAAAVQYAENVVVRDVTVNGEPLLL